MLILKNGSGRGMVKVIIKGVFPTYKKLANGTTATYWYHRATGSRLPGEKGSPEFLAAYVEAERLDPLEAVSANRVGAGA